MQKKKLNSSTKTYLFNSIIQSKRHAVGYQRNTFHTELKSWPLGSPQSWLTPWPWHSSDDWSANLSLSFLSNRVRTTSEGHYPHASPLKGLLYSDPRVPAEPAWRCLPCCGSGPPPLSLWSSMSIPHSWPLWKHLLLSAAATPAANCLLWAYAFLLLPSLHIPASALPLSLPCLTCDHTLKGTLFLFSAASGTEQELPYSSHSNTHFFFTL